jgi:hypothetical protein
VLPKFTDDGLLPAGIHPASWEDVLSAFGRSQWRGVLLLGLRDVAAALASAGCSALWLDGSFVTDVESPSDYDACWDWQGVDRGLLDPLLLDYSQAGRAVIKAKYLGDVLLAGVERGSGLPFVEFFQRTRDGQRKGIVLLNPKEVP